MKIKLFSVAAAVAFACAGQTAFAQDAPAAPAATPEFTITGSAAIVSQYRFRGLSQSDNKPAVQMAFTVADKSGFYISTWGSSASAANSPIAIGGTEIDVYGGYTHALGKSGVTFDGGLYGYIYPGAPAGNYWEIYGSLTKAYGPVSAKVGINYAPSQSVFNFNFSSPTHYNMYEYVEFGYTPPKLAALTLHSHVGYTGGGFDYGKAYLDFTAGASYKWKSLTFDVSAVGTNLTGSDISKAFNGPIQAFATSCGASVAVQKACYASGVNFWHRPAKPVAVFSVTASF